MTLDDTPMADLRLERPADGVVRLVLDNAAERNAMSDAMTDSWGRAIDAIKADASVRAVIVTGEGSAFCAGGNLAWLAGRPDATPAELREQMLPFYRQWLRIREIEVPTVAALNGAAIGAGLAMPLACDLRYATRDAKLGVPFVKLGIHPGMATTYLLPDVVGPAHARDLLLTGRLVQGDEALRLGLVSGVYDDAAALAEAVLEIAVGIAGTAPIASRLTKVALRDGHPDLEGCLRFEALAQPLTLATEDLQEGIRAAQERRAPVFRGC